MTDDLALHDPELFARVVQACERVNRLGMPITVESIGGELNRDPRLAEVTPKTIRELLKQPRLGRALEARGIPFAPLAALTAKQMHALAIYLDTAVPMTHRERLRAAGVTQAQWDGWLRQPRFMAELEQAAEQRLAGTMPLAHLKLQDAVDRGERWAIELVYEMTGRHLRNQQGQDPRELWAAVFRVLDDAGVSAEVMGRIGAAMRELAAPGSAPARAANVILAPAVTTAPPADQPAASPWPVSEE